MNNYLSKHKRTLTRQILAVFVFSWFSFIGQANERTLLMAETLSQRMMGHDIGSHCQPVLCKAVISLDDVTAHGLSSVSVIAFNALPVLQIFTMDVQLLASSFNSFRRFSGIEFDPPPLEKTGILRV